MEINWSQLLLTALTAGISGGVVSAFTTIGAVLVMRYFPKILDRVESKVKNGTKPEEKKNG
jgi:hypothetical protein